MSPPASRGRDSSGLDEPSPASTPREGAAHRAGEILDVHILDIAAQLEAILRSVRHLQQGVLRVRGALPADDESAPFDAVLERLGLMRREWATLGEAIQAALDAADGLVDGAPERPARPSTTNT